jgi:protocatechuate 3,4-dioxygenase beta subunit
LPACIVSPELTEGPYFVDQQLNRSDIRANSGDGAVREGMPLQLAVRVSQISSSGCAPLEGAIVDIWHCDALGVYSGVSDRSQGANTTSDDFLRGYQLTNADGIAQFTTIYPGWYRGRAVHIHFKVRTDAVSGQSHEFTSQLFFDESASAQVFAQEPYASKGLADTPNARDGIYRNGGEQLLLALTPTDQGYASTFDVGLQLA